MNASEWNSVVQSMVARGAAASDAEIKAIVDYLAKTVGR
jgi:cytochrome c5